MTKRSIIFILLLALTLGVVRPTSAAAEPAAELPYTVVTPAGREAAAEHLRDGDTRTRLTLTAGQILSIAWEGAAEGVLLQWYDEKLLYSSDSSAVIRLFDGEGNLLSDTTYPRLSYRMYLPAEGARRMEIQCVKNKARMISLCEAKVCAPGYVPVNLTRKEPVDLMLILSGVSDELDMLGGLLPLYAGERGIRTAIVFVGRDDGYQVQEAYRALDAMGLDVIPLFLHREDHMTSSINRLPSLWKETQLRNELADLMRAYQPKVVVTCDPEDDSARPRTIYTAKLLLDIVNRQGKKLKLPLQKLYHLSQSGTTTLDGTRPLASYGGRTAVAVAREEYAQYKTESAFRTVIPENPRFTLAYTTVGVDAQGDDLFEHIDPGTLLSYQEPTPAPDEAPVAADAPTAPAKDSPTATPDPDDQYFRQEGEPEEVVIQDYDKGHWEYRSDVLSILIDRVITFEHQNHPYCKYIAHIRMRQVDSFRSLESARQETAVANEPPWRMARNYRAVLAITGDNLNNADVHMKGILIRNGVLYADRTGDSTLVMNHDMTMRIYHPGEISGLDLMDSGVTASYSFGPILVENGQVNPDAGKHRVYKENPRCGVGMVAPGHFVAIVSDGRDVTRAYGYTLGEFAQIFVDEGAQIAYNLDGGSSAAMVFMGEHINWHSKGTQRTWADALAWGYSRLVPKVTDPLNHYGDGVKH